MPYLRSPKGTKTQLTAARLSAIVSEAYAADPSGAAGNRAAILSHCRRILAGIASRFGEDDEIDGGVLRQIISNELEHHAPLAVCEAFIRLRAVELRSVAAKPDGAPADDPIWSISPEVRAAQAVADDDGLPGIPASLVRRRAAVAGGNEARRSQWSGFWRGLGQGLSMSTWDRLAVFSESGHLHMTAEAWWWWWQDRIDAAMRHDARYGELRRALHEWRARRRLCGLEWIDDEVLAQSPWELAHGAVGDVNYRKRAAAHLQAIFPESHWDWRLILDAMDPARDRLLTWRAWLDMADGQALWPVGGALEMPQWAWMRFCMALSRTANDDMSEDAVALYVRISRMEIIPGMAAVREAGRDLPRYLEDSAWAVPDDFDGIHRVIYSSAVDSKWTGTVSSDWRSVRSKDAPVRHGRRKGAGPNEFVRTIDQHMRSQGREGSDRPTTAVLPIWHMDILEFIGLGSEGGERVQTVVGITDLFMQRVAENGSWTLLDPARHPEVLRGAEGYLLAEKSPDGQGRRTVSAATVWRKLLSQARLGRVGISFIDCDAAWAPWSGLSIHGLDGIGSFPAKTGEVISWPALAINFSSLIDEHGEPQIEDWRQTITWAFWTAEQMYKACEGRISAQTARVRPLCLGAVGFFEAVRKAMVGAEKTPESVADWVAKIGQAWATLVTVVDQNFCQQFGPAPVWEEDGWRTFHPQRCRDRLLRSRGGGTGMPAIDPAINEVFNRISAHRFSVRAVWAPFQQAASWAGVSPGGFGTLFPVEWIPDDGGKQRLMPTPFLISEMRDDPRLDCSAIMKHPESVKSWPESIRKLCVPDMQEWKTRMTHAALVRPWVDQGVSMTLPAGLAAGDVALLIQQAWWMGLSNIRFEDPFKRPDGSA